MEKELLRFQNTKYITECLKMVTLMDSDHMLLIMETNMDFSFIKNNLTKLILKINFLFNKISNNIT